MYDKKIYPRNKYYINLENGNLLTFGEMLEEASELYDFDDWTNFAMPKN